MEIRIGKREELRGQLFQAARTVPHEGAPLGAELEKFLQQQQIGLLGKKTLCEGMG